MKTPDEKYILELETKNAELKEIIRQLKALVEFIEISAAAILTSVK